jgi:hypothetical protein
MPVVEITEKNSLQRQINLLRVAWVSLAVVLSLIGADRLRRR